MEGEIGKEMELVFDQVDILSFSHQILKEANLHGYLRVLHRSSQNLQRLHQRDTGTNQDTEHDSKTGHVTLEKGTVEPEPTGLSGYDPTKYEDSGREEGQSGNPVRGNEIRGGDQDSGRQGQGSVK